MRPLRLVCFAAVVATLGTGGCELVWGLDNPQLYPALIGGGGSGGAGGTGGMTTGSMPVCAPAETKPCNYTGPDGTENVGICKAGTQTCTADGSEFGACVGEVVPGAEDCSATGDENCDGIPCSEAVFVKQFGDSAVQAGYAVAVDPSTGDVVVAGGFQSAMQLGGQLLTSAGAGDIFVAKLSPIGNVLWAKGFGDVKEQRATAVAIGADGAIVVAVANVLGGAVDFGGGSASTPIVIVKLTPNGNHKWTRTCGGSPFGFVSSSPLSVAVDLNDDLLVAGVVSGSLDCGNGALPGMPSAAFVVKLSGDTGVAEWVHIYGGAEERATGVATDSMGNALVVGQFSETINFGDGDLTASGAADAFVAKLSPTGTTVWSKRFGDGGMTLATDVAVDALGGPLVVGTFDTAVTFGNAATKLTSNGGTDLFAAKLNAAGGHAWSIRLGDDADSVGYPVTAFDEGGDFIVAGAFKGVVELGSQDFASNDLDSFVAKLDGATGMFRWGRQVAGVGSTSSGDVAVGKTHHIALTGSFSGALDLGTGELTSVGGGDVFVALLWP